MKAYTCLEHSSCLFIELSKVDANFISWKLTLLGTIEHEQATCFEGFSKMFVTLSAHQFLLTNQASDFKVKLNKVRGKT